MSTTPTDQDYTRSLAADLAIQQAATPGLWVWIDELGDGAHLESASGETVIHRAWNSNTGHTIVESKSNRTAIAAAHNNAPAWLRRLIAAEAAILEWAEAMADDDNLSPGADARLDAAMIEMLALAARIRAGREKGAQGA